jgi:hypothetical protein
MLFHIYETFLVYYAIFHFENTVNPFYNHTSNDHFYYDANELWFKHV